MAAPSREGAAITSPPGLMSTKVFVIFLQLFGAVFYDNYMFSRYPEIQDVV